MSSVCLPCGAPLAYTQCRSPTAARRWPSSWPTRGRRSRPSYPRPKPLSRRSMPFMPALSVLCLSPTARGGRGMPCMSQRREPPAKQRWRHGTSRSRTMFDCDASPLNVGTLSACPLPPRLSLECKGDSAPDSPHRPAPRRAPSNIRVCGMAYVRPRRVQSQVWARYGDRRWDRRRPVNRIGKPALTVRPD